MLRNILVHSHSGLRWIVILAFLITLVLLAFTVFGKKNRASLARKSALFALIFTHIQLIIGLVLYFISPLVVFSSASMKNPVYRFYLVEHISIMLIAIVFVTIGYSKGKKAADVAVGARKMFYYYLLGFLLILISIPWPFRNLGASWF